MNQNDEALEFRTRVVTSTCNLRASEMLYEDFCVVCNLEEQVQGVSRLRNIELAELRARADAADARVEELARAKAGPPNTVTLSRKDAEQISELMNRTWSGADVSQGIHSVIDRLDSALAANHDG